MSSSLFGSGARNRLNTGGHAAATVPRSTKGRLPANGFGGGRQSQGQIQQQRQLRQHTTRDQRTMDAQTDEILRDLRLLQGHQQASQQNLKHVQRAKEQKERQRLSLEQQLESNKYSNEEQRAQIERNRQLLSTSDRLLSVQRRTGTRAESDLKDFNKWLTKSLGGNRINNSNKRKIESLLIYLSSKAERLALLKAKARSKPQHLERLRDLAKHKHESLRQSLNEESNKASVCYEEVSKVRSEISELERDLAATQNSEVSTRTSVQDLDVEIQDGKTAHSKALDLLRKGLEDCTTAEAQSDAMDAEMQSRVDDITQKNANLQAHLAQLLKEEGYGVRSENGEDEPFNATDAIAVVESSLQEQQQALEKARTKKEELTESIDRLKTKTSACQEKELSTRTKISQVAEEAKEAQEKQTERRTELEKHIHNLDDAKKELENLEGAFSDIKESSAKHRDQASERAKENLETIEKEKENISSLESKLHDMSASIDSLRESWSQTKIANENKKVETNRMVEDARASFENVKTDLKELLSLKESPLSLEKETLYQQEEAAKLKAAIANLLEEHPDLTEVRPLPEPDSETSLLIADDKAQACLEPIVEFWSKETKAAKDRVDVARKAAIAERDRLSEEAEKQRKLQEAEQERLEAEQERKRKEKEAAEQRRLAAEQKRNLKEAEKQRKLQEAEQRRLEAEKQRELEEAEEQRELEEAEQRRLEVEQKRKQREDVAEKRRQLKEAAAEKKGVEAEEKRKQKEEASEKKRVEAEQKRKQRAEEKRKERAEEKQKQKEEEKEQPKAARKGKGGGVEPQQANDKSRHKPRRRGNDSSKAETAEQLGASSSKQGRSSLETGSKGSKRKISKQIEDDWEEADAGDTGEANPEASFDFDKPKIDTSAMSQATFTPKRRPSLKDSSYSTGMQSQRSLYSQSSNKRVRWEDSQKDDDDDEELSDPEDLGAPPSKHHTKSARSRSIKSRLGDDHGDKSSSKRRSVSKSAKQSRDRVVQSSGSSNNEGGVLGITTTTKTPKSKSKDPKASKLLVAEKDPQKEETSLTGTDTGTSSNRKSTSSKKKKIDSSLATDELDQPVRSKDKSKRPMTGRLSKESKSKHSSRKSLSSSAHSLSSLSKKRRHSSSDPLGRKMPKYSAAKPRRKGKKKDGSVSTKTVSTKAFSDDIKFSFM